MKSHSQHVHWKLQGVEPVLGLEPNSLECLIKEILLYIFFLKLQYTILCHRHHELRCDYVPMTVQFSFDNGTILYNARVLLHF